MLYMSQLNNVCKRYSKVKKVDSTNLRYVRVEEESFCFLLNITLNGAGSSKNILICLGCVALLANSTYFANSAIISIANPSVHLG